MPSDAIIAAFAKESDPSLNYLWWDKRLRSATKHEGLGAKWDMATKKWFVEDLPNLRVFLKWIDPHLTRPFVPQVPVTPRPKHSRPDGRKFGKKANLDFLRRQHEAERRKERALSRNIGRNSGKSSSER